MAAAFVALLIGIGGATVSAQAADAPIWNSRRIISIAHAGGDLEAPHSTIYAMKQALAAGADVLEMDVRLSSDNVLMVQHDDTVDRTTGSTGLVSSFTASQLQAMDNAYWFYPDCWSCHSQPVEDYSLRGIRTGAVAAPDGYTAEDFRVATLLDVVDAFPGQRFDIEIKGGPTGMAAAEALAAFINTHGPIDRYIVASFDDEILAHFKSLAPGVFTSPGVGLVTSWFGARGALPGQKVLQVPPFYGAIEVVTQKFVDDAHANGLAVWVWFNGDGDDGPATWIRMMALGVDGILTGKPKEAEPYIAAANASAAVTTTTTSLVTGRASNSSLPNTGSGDALWLLGGGTTLIGAVGVFMARKRPALLSN